MPARPGSERAKTCNGITQLGKSCTSYVKEGADFCHWHRLQALAAPGTSPAEVIPFAKAKTKAKASVESGLMTRDEYAEWLREFMDGDVTETIQTSRGEIKEAVEISAKDRLAAGREYRMLMDWDKASKGEGAFRRAVEDVVAEILG